jgi:mono/diheme cytochrome c family protein
MVFAISTGNEIAIAVVGAAFILFALTSAFVIPRRDPNFPGRGLALYVLVSIGFFVAMISAILVFGKEKKTEAATHEAAPQAAPAGGGASGPYANGDATAGKQVFMTAGCAQCHTLAAANAHGTICPNLDQRKPDRAKIILRVTKGKAAMPSFKGQLSDKQIADVVAFVYTSTHA